ncbi:hypothetical protein FQN50_002706 [Emmonsiellopsis sp. PD_5]|nr:hypothetical protein FQN50_002706 [Emmonsiellopsis sp. PD_5]
MGKGGRIACIFTPYILTLGSLACLILVGLGMTKPSSPLNTFYFVKADLKDIDTNSDGIAEKLLPFTHGLQQADGRGQIHDYYLIGLWNHCYKDEADKEWKCTDRKTKYYFDPVAEWGLDDSQAEGFLPERLDDGISAYKKVTGWMFVAFVIAFVATLVEILVGISAIFSRWGSLVTTVVSSVSSFFYIAAAVTATALYGILVGAVNTSLKPYEIKSSLGKNMFATLWIGVAFSLASGLFWLFSVCCCSGRSPYGHDDRRGKRTYAEKTPYTYERVSSPYGGPQGSSAVPLTSMPAPPAGRDMAYEPFRHDSRA